jgi:hypothetical protein
MLVSRSQACNTPNSTSPLSPAGIAVAQAQTQQLNAAVRNAQLNVNNILVRSPLDFPFGWNFMADVYSSNLNNGQPGVVSPGSSVPAPIAPYLRSPGSAPYGAAGSAPWGWNPVNHGGWGGRMPGFYERLYPIGAAARRGPYRENRHHSADSLANQGTAAGPGPSGGSAAGGPVTTKTAARGGFVGRGSTCAASAPAVEIVEMQATGNPPAMPLVVGAAPSGGPAPVTPTPVVTPMTPPVIPTVGLGNAYPMGGAPAPINCTPANQAGQVGGAAPSNDSGCPWWVWALVIGGGVLWAASGDEPKRRRAA